MDGVEYGGVLHCQARQPQIHHLQARTLYDRGTLLILMYELSCRLTSCTSWSTSPFWQMRGRISTNAGDELQHPQNCW